MPVWFGWKRRAYELEAMVGGTRGMARRNKFQPGLGGVELSKEASQ
jgi:hypothetical protein